MTCSRIEAAHTIRCESDIVRLAKGYGPEYAHLGIMTEAFPKTIVAD